MHEVGDLLLQNGFQAPVMEMEKLTLTYQTVIDLLKDLKAIGAQSVRRRAKSLTGKTKFQLMIKLYETYRQDGKIPATYEIIYGHAWKKMAQLGSIEIKQD
jgi:malonyl-CoA O-methyltransferase